MTSSKTVKFILESKKKQWVGNGFYVHSLLKPDKDIYQFTSPFLLLDYAPNRNFPADGQKRGVGAHPHKGFETVTFAHRGEVSHKDSSGGGGTIKEGDVQWMTAGNGIIHEEYHSPSFCKKGGLLEMTQLWINLPQKFKKTKAHYQNIKKAEIPLINITNKTNLKIIAGKYLNKIGPAETFTKINIMEIDSYDDDFSLSLEKKSNTLLLIRQGKVKVQKKIFSENTLVIFSKEGENIKIESQGECKALLLNGEPIHESFVWHGPFVMNTKEEIMEAIKEYS